MEVMPREFVRVVRKQECAEEKNGTHTLVFDAAGICACGKGKENCTTHMHLKRQSTVNYTYAE